MTLPIQFIEEVPRNWREYAKQREAEMAERFLSGETLSAIGTDYALTRERVRQILKKAGLTGKNGGHSRKALISVEDRKVSRARKASHQETNDLRRWGMSTEAINALSPFVRSHQDHPIRIFERWRQNIKLSGVRLEVKFVDWWRAWEESGKWEERGRGYGYWAARWDRNQGWTKDNLRIVSGAERVSDSYIQVTAAERAAKAAKTRAAKAQGIPQ